MASIFKEQNGMNVVGQGGKIILFMLPALIAAILIDTYLPRVAALPQVISFIRPLGYVLLPIGLVMWAMAIIQLLTGYSRGKLVTAGAYGIARNPIYASATFFVFPGISLLTFTWVYFVVSVVLYVGVLIFIGKEEEQLAKVFGAEYEDFKARVHRLIPFKKP